MIPRKKFVRPVWNGADCTAAATRCKLAANPSTVIPPAACAAETNPPRIVTTDAMMLPSARNTSAARPIHSVICPVRAAWVAHRSNARAAPSAPAVNPGSIDAPARAISPKPRTTGPTAADRFRNAAAPASNTTEKLPIRPCSAMASANDTANALNAPAVATSPRCKSGSASTDTISIASAIPRNSSCWTACCISPQAGATCLTASAASLADGAKRSNASANAAGSSMFFRASPNPRKPNTSAPIAPADALISAGSNARMPTVLARSPARDNTCGVTAAIAAPSAANPAA